MQDKSSESSDSEEITDGQLSELKKRVQEQDDFIRSMCEHLLCNLTEDDIKKIPNAISSRISYLPNVLADKKLIVESKKNKREKLGKESPSKFASSPNKFTASRERSGATVAFDPSQQNKAFEDLALKIEASKSEIVIFDITFSLLLKKYNGRRLLDIVAECSKRIPVIIYLMNPECFSEKSKAKTGLNSKEKDEAKNIAEQVLKESHEVYQKFNDDQKRNFKMYLYNFPCSYAIQKIDNCCRIVLYDHSYSKGGVLVFIFNCGTSYYEHFVNELNWLANLSWETPISRKKSGDVSVVSVDRYLGVVPNSSLDLIPKKFDIRELKQVPSFDGFPFEDVFFLQFNKEEERFFNALEKDIESAVQWFTVFGVSQKILIYGRESENSDQLIDLVYQKSDRIEVSIYLMDPSSECKAWRSLIDSSDVSRKKAAKFVGDEVLLSYYSRCAKTIEEDFSKGKKINVNLYSFPCSTGIICIDDKCYVKFYGHGARGAESPVMMFSRKHNSIFFEYFADQLKFLDDLRSKNEKRDAEIVPLEKWKFDGYIFIRHMLEVIKNEFGDKLDVVNDFFCLGFVDHNAIHESLFIIKNLRDSRTFLEMLSEHGIVSKNGKGFYAISEANQLLIVKYLEWSDETNISNVCSYIIKKFDELSKEIFLTKDFDYSYIKLPSSLYGLENHIYHFSNLVETKRLDVTAEKKTYLKIQLRAVYCFHLSSQYDLARRILDGEVINQEHGKIIKQSLITQAEEVFTDSENCSTLGYFYLMSGKNHVGRGDFAKATKEYDKVLKLEDPAAGWLVGAVKKFSFAKDAKLLFIKSIAYSRKGSISISKELTESWGFLQESLSHHKKSSKLERTEYSAVEEAITLMYLADYYREIGDYERAKLEYQKARDLFYNFYNDYEFDDDKNMHPYLAEVDYRLCICHRKLGDFEKAKSYIEKAQKNFENAYFSKPHSKILNCRIESAKIFLDSDFLEETEKSLENLKEGYDLLTEVGKIELNYTYACLHYRTGEHNEAQKKCEEALDLLFKLSNRGNYKTVAMTEEDKSIFALLCKTKAFESLKLSNAKRIIHSISAKIVCFLAMNAYKLGEYDNSKLYYNEYFLIDDAIHSSLTPEVSCLIKKNCDVQRVRAFCNVANIFYREGNYHSAVKKIQDNLFSDGVQSAPVLHIHRYAHACLARIRLRMGKYVEALDSSKIATKDLKARNFEELFFYLVHAKVLFYSGELSDSWLACKKALEEIESIQKKVKLNFIHSVQIGIYQLIGRILLLLGYDFHAEKYLRKALDGQLKKFHLRHADTGRLYRDLGQYYLINYEKYLANYYLDLSRYIFEDHYKPTAPEILFWRKSKTWQKFVEARYAQICNNRDDALDKFGVAYENYGKIHQYLSENSEDIDLNSISIMVSIELGMCSVSLHLYFLTLHEPEKNNYFLKFKRFFDLSIRRIRCFTDLIGKDSAKQGAHLSWVNFVVHFYTAIPLYLSNEVNTKDREVNILKVCSEEWLVVVNMLIEFFSSRLELVNELGLPPVIIDLRIVQIRLQIFMNKKNEASKSTENILKEIQKLNSDYQRDPYYKVIHFYLNLLLIESGPKSELKSKLQLLENENAETIEILKNHREIDRYDIKYYHHEFERVRSLCLKEKVAKTSLVKPPLNKKDSLSSVTRNEFRNNLPLFENFFGRSDNLKSSLANLEKERIALILGDIGSGKSHFAVQLARQFFKKHTGGSVFFINVENNKSIFLSLRQAFFCINQKNGYQGVIDNEILRLFLDMLEKNQEKKCLILLDGFVNVDTDIKRVLNFITTKKIRETHHFILTCSDSKEKVEFNNAKNLLIDYFGISDSDWIMRKIVINLNALNNETNWKSELISNTNSKMDSSQLAQWARISRGNPLIFRVLVLICPQDASYFQRIESCFVSAKETPLAILRTILYELLLGSGNVLDQKNSRGGRLSFTGVDTELMPKMISQNLFSDIERESFLCLTYLNCSNIEKSVILNFLEEEMECTHESAGKVISRLTSINLLIEKNNCNSYEIHQSLQNESFHKDDENCYAKILRFVLSKMQIERDNAWFPDNGKTGSSLYIYHALNMFYRIKVRDRKELSFEEISLIFLISEYHLYHERDSLKTLKYLKYVEDKKALFVYGRPEDIANKDVTSAIAENLDNNNEDDDTVRKKISYIRYCNIRSYAHFLRCKYWIAERIVLLINSIQSSMSVKILKIPEEEICMNKFIYALIQIQYHCRYDEGGKVLEELVLDYKRLSLHESEMITCYELGRVQSLKKNFEKAVVNFNIALNIHKEKYENKKLVHAYYYKIILSKISSLISNKIAQNQKSTGLSMKFDDELKELERVENEYKTIFFDFPHIDGSELKFLRARIFYEQKKYNDAYNLIIQVIDMREAYYADYYNDFIIEGYKLIGRVCLFIGRYNSAMYYFCNCVTLSLNRIYSILLKDRKKDVHLQVDEFSEIIKYWLASMFHGRKFAELLQRIQELRSVFERIRVESVEGSVESKNKKTMLQYKQIKFYLDFYELKVKFFESIQQKILPKEIDSFVDKIHELESECYDSSMNNNAQIGMQINRFRGQIHFFKRDVESAINFFEESNKCIETENIRIKIYEVMNYCMLARCYGHEDKQDFGKANEFFIFSLKCIQTVYLNDDLWNHPRIAEALAHYADFLYKTECYKQSNVNELIKKMVIAVRKILDANAYPDNEFFSEGFNFNGLYNEVTDNTTPGFKEIKLSKNLITEIVEDVIKKMNGVQFDNRLIKPLIKEQNKQDAVQANSWNLPPENHNFTGRVELLEEIRMVLSKQAEEVKEIKESSTHLPIVVTVLCGLGGVGKTQLVTQYAYQNCHRYNRVFWIRADSSEGLQANYFALAKELGLQGERPEDTLKRVKHWLESNPLNLLIYDDVPDFDVIRTYLPERGCHVLMTSRFTKWPGESINIKLDCFTKEECRDYVQEILRDRGGLDTLEDIDDLANTLGRLPLALAQVCGYLTQVDEINIQEYLKRYREVNKSDKIKFLSSTTLPAGNKDDHAPVSVTFELSRQGIQKKSPFAEKLLNVCAFLYLQNIPDFLLKEIGGQNDFNPARDDVSKALTLLGNFSLIDRDLKTKASSIHVLVQEIIRLNLSQDEVTRYVNWIYQALIKLFPYGEGQDKLEHINIQRLLLSHFVGLLPLIEDDENKLMIVLERMQHVYGNLGDARKKKESLERALPIFKKRCRDYPHYVAITLGNLGNAYGALGDAHKQKKLHEDALAIKESYYGLEHPETAVTLTNIGIAYGALGDAQKSKEFLERALVIDEKSCDPNCYKMPIALENLWNAKGIFDDVSKKKELLERSFVIKDKHYSDHYQVAKTLINLGNAYGALGDARKKKELTERALAIREKHYGLDHYLVAAALDHLGSAYGALGDARKQKELLERALVINEKHYGSDHPEMARTLSNLGVVEGVLGNLQQSKTLLIRALAVFEKYYGKENYSAYTCITLIALGNIVDSLGDTDEGRAFIKYGVLLEKTYHENHGHKVEFIQTSLGRLHNVLGIEDKQKELLERCLPVYQACYGVEHEYTQEIIKKLKSTIMERVKEIKETEEIKKIKEVKQEKQRILEAIGKNEKDVKQFGDVHIERAEVNYAISDENNYYTADFINLLIHYRINQQKHSIKAYPALRLEELKGCFEHIVSQKGEYAFVPLNIAYDEKNPKHKNHWVALIIDKEHKLIFYLDPAQKTTVPEAVEALKEKLNCKSAILTSPTDFQSKEKEVGWIRHCGVYTVEIFKVFEKFIREHKCIAGATLADLNVDKNSVSLETALSEIPSGEAENCSQIRKNHITEVAIVLGVRDMKEIQDVKLPVKDLMRKIDEAFSAYEFIGKRDEQGLLHPTHDKLQGAIKSYLLELKQKSSKLKQKIDALKGKTNLLIEKTIPTTWEECRKFNSQSVDSIRKDHAEGISTLPDEDQKMLNMMFDDLSGAFEIKEMTREGLLKKLHNQMLFTIPEDQKANFVEGKNPPSCFLCYSWGDSVHAKKVRKLATFLKLYGINVILDIWDNKTNSVPVFTSKVSSADFVVVVGTPSLQEKWKNYISQGESRGKKEDDYRGSVLAQELEKLSLRKTKNPSDDHGIICLLLEGEHEKSFPDFLESLASDAMNAKDWNNRHIPFFNLLETLYGKDKSVSALVTQIREAYLNKIHETKWLSEGEIRRELADFAVPFAQLSKERNTFSDAAIIKDKKNSPSKNLLSGKDKEKLNDANLQSPAKLEPTFGKLWNFPPKNFNFTGRVPLLEGIKKGFPNSLNRYLPPTVIVLHGLPGVGKTQLAAQFVYDTLEEDPDLYSHILWIPGDTLENMEQKYLELAEIFKVSGITPKKKIDEVKKWIETNPFNLVIYDDAPDFEAIKHYLPSAGCHILITSRYTEWPSEQFKIDCFTPEECRRYVKKILGARGVDSVEDIDELAKTLGGLPLALAQACGYMTQYDKINIKTYLERYHVEKQKYLANKILPAGESNRKGENAIHEPVYITFKLAKEAIEKESKLAGELLDICAFLHHENIPDFLLQKIAGENDLNLLESDFSEALTLLGNFSLIQRDLKSQACGIHVLVQTVLYKETKERHVVIFKNICAVLGALFVCNRENLDGMNKLSRLVLHVCRLVNLIDQGETLQSSGRKLGINVCKLGYQLGSYYGFYGMTDKEKAYLEKALSIEEKEDSEDDKVEILHRLGTHESRKYFRVYEREENKNIGGIFLRKAMLLRKKIHDQNPNSTALERMIHTKHCFVSNQLFYSYNADKNFCGNDKKINEIVEEAKQIQDELCETPEYMHNKNKVALSCLNYAVYHALKSNYKQAMECINKGISEFETNNKTHSELVLLYLFKARILCAEKDKQAEIYYLKAIDFCEKFNFCKQHHFDALMELGDLYYSLNNPDFIKLYKKSLELSQKQFGLEDPHTIKIRNILEKRKILTLCNLPPENHNFTGRVELLEEIRVASSKQTKEKKENFFSEMSKIKNTGLINQKKDVQYYEEIKMQENETEQSTSIVAKQTKQKRPNHDLISFQESLEKHVIALKENPLGFGISAESVFCQVISVYQNKPNSIKELNNYRKSKNKKWNEVVQEKDNAYGFNITHYCAATNQWALFNYIRGEGIGGDLLKTQNGFLPSHIAALTGQSDFLLQELKHEKTFQVASVRIGDSTFNLNELHCALMAGDKITKQVLEEIFGLVKNIDPLVPIVGSLLHMAVIFSDVEKLKYLFWNSYQNGISQKTWLTTTDVYGRTPLGLAAALGRIDHVRYLLGEMLRNVDLLEGLQLIEKAFYLAAKAEKKKVVKYFLESGFMPQAEHGGYNDTMQHLGKDSPVYVIIDGTVKRKYYKRYEKAEPKEQQYENVVLQGGGMKGAVYPDAKSAFEDCCKKRQEEFKKQYVVPSDVKLKQLSGNVVRVLGTSAGAISALGWALGLSNASLADEMNIDFSKFLEGRDDLASVLINDDASLKQKLETLLNDCGINIQETIALAEKLQREVSDFQNSEEGRWGATKKVASGLGKIYQNGLLGTIYQTAVYGKNIFDELSDALEKIKKLNSSFDGLVSGKKIYRWLQGLIKKGYLSEDITFGEWGNLIRSSKRSDLKHLHVVVTREKNGEAFTLSTEDKAYENYLVVDAVRASMSIPLVFTPHRLKIKAPNGEISETKERYLDGGILRNYAIDEFDTKHYTNPDQIGRSDFPEFNKATIGFRFKPTKIEAPKLEEKTVIGFLFHLANIYYNAESILGRVRDIEYSRGIELDSGKLVTLSFRKLSSEELADLKKTTYESVCKYFGYTIKEVLGEEETTKITGIKVKERILDAIGKNEKDVKQFGDVHIERAEVNYAISDENNYYTADFINLLIHYRINQQKHSIKAYPAFRLEELKGCFEQIASQKEEYAFVPLNVAYDENNSKHKNHWVALIIDKKHKLVFYLDPAQETKIPKEVEALKEKLRCEKTILTNPVDFQSKEKEEGWIRHCGVYTVEIFKVFEKYIRENKCIADATLADVNIDNNSVSLETALSEIPSGEAENCSKIRQDHVTVVAIVLGIKDIKEDQEIKSPEAQDFVNPGKTKAGIYSGSNDNNNNLLANVSAGTVPRTSNLKNW